MTCSSSLQTTHSHPLPKEPWQDGHTTRHATSTWICVRSRLTEVRTATSSFQGDPLAYSLERLGMAVVKYFEAWEGYCTWNMAEFTRGLTDLSFAWNGGVCCYSLRSCLPGGWDHSKAKLESDKWLCIPPCEGSYLQQKYKKAMKEAIHFCNMVLYMNLFQFILQ